MAKASIDVNSPVSTSVDAAALFFLAVADCGMSDKEAAYTMALDPAQLSRVKSGQARLPFDAMWRLPNRFWLAFHARVVDAKQLTEANARAINRQRIVELVNLLLTECA